MNFTFFFLLSLTVYECYTSEKSGEYIALYGLNSLSIKVDMLVAFTRSRIHCAWICDMIQACGGFNFRTLAKGLFQCEFKQGISIPGKNKTENNVTYYEKKDIKKFGAASSGVYEVNMDPDGSEPKLTEVYCDMDTDGGGWTMLIKREDGSTDFTRNWTEYRTGFGNISGEYWLGLENMYTLTNNGRSYKLRVDIQLFNEQSYFAEYSSFSVGPETGGYILQVSGYTGNAGDALAYHDNLKFSTIDVDNDLTDKVHCAISVACGFWFKSCSDARPTGLYGENIPPLSVNGTYMAQGIFWLSDLNGQRARYIDMKIRP